MDRIEQAVTAALEYVSVGMSPADGVDCVVARFGLSGSERDHAVGSVEDAVADALVGPVVDSHVTRAYCQHPHFLDSVCKRCGLDITGAYGSEAYR